MHAAQRAAASALLGPDDPAPVGVLNEDSDSRFFLICDHAGNAVPRRLSQLGLPQAELDRHIGIDIGALGVAQALAERLGATLVFQRYSRLLIDCNRQPHAPTAMAEVADGTEVPGNRGLDAAARDLRIAEVMRPYHDAIKAALDARDARGQPTFLVAMHSFTPRLLTQPTDRPWWIGLCWGPNDRFSRHTLQHLADDDGGLVIGANEPYTVDMVHDYSIPVHGEDRGLDYLEIELRQDLLAETAAQIAWAERLARVLNRAADTYRHLPRPGARPGGAA
jgi:predicted N-formylglutamate amidohydrolase